MRIFNNNNNNTLSITPYNVAEQLLTIYSGTENWSAETVLQTVAHSYLSNVGANATDVAAAFQYLNYKLEAVRKTISFWDAYQIRGSVQANNLQAQLAQLPNNSSLINNAPLPFTWVDENNKEHTVYTGDVFLKDYLNHIHLVPATNKGIYQPTAVSNYPIFANQEAVNAAGSQLYVGQIIIVDGEQKKITDITQTGNTYVVTYVSDSSTGPSTISIQYQYVEEINDADQTRHLTWYNVNFGDNSGYNRRGQINANDYVEIDALQYQSINIKPIVKIFTNTNPYELIFNGYNVELQANNKYRITNNMAITVYYEVR